MTWTDILRQAADISGTPYAEVEYRLQLGLGAVAVAAILLLVLVLAVGRLRAEG